MKKKITFYILIILITFSSAYIYRFSIYKSLSKNTQSIFRVIFSNKVNTMRLNNDYNVKFLPETQFSYFSFKKISLNTNNVNESGYGNFLKKRTTKTFFIDILNNTTFITFLNGDIYNIKISKLLKNQNDLKKIDTNLEKIKVLDTLIHNDNLIVSGAENIAEDCKNFVILKGKISLNKISFKKKIIDKKCYETIQSGRIQFDKKLNGLIISTAADILKFKDQNDSKPQDSNSIMGKIIFYDFDSERTTIISKGHRNVLGLLSFDGNILSTENGPKGGDEINLIKFGKNYGWPISSYGEKYKSINSNELFYLKSHEDYGFEEPIYSFIPSIGISEIIKLDNSFSKFWQDNFIIGSLNSRHIYRVKFNKKFNKVNYIEKIYLGERIRDMKYSKKNNIILMALEDTGSIGIISQN